MSTPSNSKKKGTARKSTHKKSRPALRETQNDSIVAERAKKAVSRKKKDETIVEVNPDVSFVSKKRKILKTINS